MFSLKPSDWSTAHPTIDQRELDGFSRNEAGNLRFREGTTDIFKVFISFFPIRKWLDSKHEMRERHSYLTGNDSTAFTDETLCAFLGISIILSVTGMSIDEVFNTNFVGVRDVMPAWKYHKMLQSLRWPGQSAVEDPEVSSVDSDFKLTQGKPLGQV